MTGSVVPMKKKAFIFLLCCLLALALAVPSMAEELESEKEYKPLDLVLVIDGSLSMRTSDPERTALAAGRMMVNMMPADDSRVAIISFNTKATVHTADTSGHDALIGLDAFTGVETVREGLTAIEYKGDTGIGNALYAAVQLLQECSDSSHQRAIILFTDGLNDFGGDDLALARCDENEAAAIQWAKQNDCYIYCVGYDYMTSSGVSSMGADGEGIEKLSTIAESTGGKFRAITNISEIEQLLIEFLADVCDLNYKTIATIPGDGGFHECPIPVSPSVVEANIRIAGGDTDAIANGRIRLYDPTGKEIELTNSGNVRFDTDATAASIKVTMPRAGEWLLTVEGISGEDIHVGLLEHFKMNLNSTLTFPDGNPPGVAYSNDVVGIRTWLSYDGADLDDEAVYDAVTSAQAKCVSRADPDDVKIIDLQRDGKSFVGSFVIPEDSFYDIYIRLDWDTVYREDQLTVMSSNKPVSLMRDIESVEVNKGKTVVIDNIYQYVYDDENDPVSAEISTLTAPDVADVAVDGDMITVTGLKWSSTLATVVYRDEQGNTVETTFKITVKDPVAVALIIGTIVLIVLAVLGLLYFLYRRTFRIRGKIRIAQIMQRELKDGRVVSEKIVYEDHGRIFQDALKKSAAPWTGDSPAASPEPGPFDSPFGGGEGFGNDPGSFGDSWFDTPDAGGWGFEEPQPAQEEKESGGGFGFGFGEDPSQDPGEPAENSRERQKDDQLDREFQNGEMEISAAAGRANPNLLNVLNTFVDNYAAHMTAMGRESERARQVESFVKFNFSPFAEVKIGGSPRGRQGIVLMFPKKTRIKAESPRIVKNRISTKESGRKPVLFKFSVPSEDGLSEACVEIEYINT